MAFCTGCGNRLPEGVKFCPSCGQAVALPTGSSAPAATPPPPPPPPPASSFAPPPPVPATPPPPPAAPRREQEEPREEGLGGLAKRWLKTQVNLSLDPHQARRDADEARRIENQMERRVEEQRDRAIADAFLPQGWKTADLERRTREREAAAEQRRREQHAARPRADVQATFTGSVTGSFRGGVPIDVGWPGEPGEALTVNLEPLEPVDLGGGHSFEALQFAVPGFAGAGTYDLSAYESRDDWDGTWFGLMLDGSEEGYYWTAEYGPGVITVEPDGRTLRVRLAMEDSGSSHVDVDALVVLP